MRTHHTFSRTAWLATAAGICGISLVSLAAISPTPDSQRQQPPSILLDSVEGSDSFQRYCATCHGRGGKGDGQVGAALKTRPADLTQLARRNDGLYPAERVRAVVAGYGSALPVHGPTEMPVWGPIFRALDPSDVRVAIRIDNIVEYVGKIQEPTTGANSLGAQLFKTHCAVCHGTDARGTGAATSELRNRPPDLTGYTARNGGVFPRERLYQIIDGRFVRSHGDRDMPIWGDAFAHSREGLSDTAVKARIDAIVGYIEGVPRRGA